jgi:hypothetical protein
VSRDESVGTAIAPWGVLRLTEEDRQVFQRMLEPGYQGRADTELERLIRQWFRIRLARRAGQERQRQQQ